MPATDCIKTLVVAADDESENELIALVLRGDHELNELKAEKLAGVASPLQFANPEQLPQALGASVGSLGPLGLAIPMLVDHSAAQLVNFVCGANTDGVHYTGVNWGRDVPLDDSAVVDLRNVVDGDPAPDGEGRLRMIRGIEVGHIFQLGTKYSDAMDATVLNPDGRAQRLIMGCYGLGITRLVAAIIEQCHDDNGIVWPAAVAPFDVHLLALNYTKSETVRTAADSLYDELQTAGFSVLFDDRAERPGVKFADADLLGLPHRITVGDRGLKDGQVEYRQRQQADNESVALGDVITRLG